MIERLQDVMYLHATMKVRNEDDEAKLTLTVTVYTVNRLLRSSSYDM